jgi:hypothetical protein
VLFMNKVAHPKGAFMKYPKFFSHFYPSYEVDDEKTGQVLWKEKKKNAHWSKQFIFLKFVTSCEEEILLDNMPSRYTSNVFLPMLYDDPKSHEISNGPTHVMCNVKRDFTLDPKSFSLVYHRPAHPTPPHPLVRIKWCWMKVLCHLEHVFCHESQIKELVPLLCCHVVLIK